MTVKELKKKLENADDDWQVVVLDDNGNETGDFRVSLSWSDFGRVVLIAGFVRGLEL